MQVSNETVESAELIADTRAENISLTKFDHADSKENDLIEDDEVGCWQSFRFFLKHSY